EEDAAPEPEREPAPVAPERRRDADPAAAAPCEEVDRRREERQESADQHELDRPAADDPRAEVEVARRSGRERDRLLRGPADLPEPGRAQAARLVVEAGLRPVRRGRDRQGRDAAADECRLLVAREGEAEVDQLPEGARTARVVAALGGEARAHGLDEARRRGA